MRISHVLIALSLAAAPVAAESAAGVVWTAPAGWTAQAPRPMRAATYSLASASGDTAAAECGVYFFGAGQGGTVDANIARWKDQFTGRNGAPAPAKVATRTIHGLTVTTIDASGTYSGLGGPVGPTSSVSGYRLLGAIVAAPGGNIFVKCTGPAKTMAANGPKFEQLLASFHTGK
ncbi:MAG TPA: hypothetical protein VG871_03960 [Vicinamibacterales bacterium]|nr:hypothetical protein [Vicinamibacterales bacterium]